MSRAEEIAEIRQEIAEINETIKKILKSGQSFSWSDGNSKENANLQVLYARKDVLQKRLKSYKIKKRVLYKKQ